MWLKSDVAAKATFHRGATGKTKGLGLDFLDRPTEVQRPRQLLADGNSKPAIALDGLLNMPTRPPTLLRWCLRIDFFLESHH